MDTQDSPELDALQDFAAEKFHFAQVAEGTPVNRTPLALLASGESDAVLDEAGLVEMTAPLGLSREALKAHLGAAYRAIEG